MKRAVRQAYTALVPHRRLINVLGDSAFWILAVVGGVILRFDFRIPGAYVSGPGTLLPIAIAAQFLVGLTDGLYVGRWSVGSFEEVAALARTVTITAAVMIAVDIPTRLVPLSVAIIAPVLALAAMSGSRYAWRS